MGKWFPSNGWRTQLTQPTGADMDLVIYGATPLGGALCCDAALVSPPTRTAQPQPCAAAADGAALRMAERRKRAAYPELSAAAGGHGHRGRGPVERGSVAPRARSGPRALRPPSTLPLGPPGRDGGGPNWQSQCSKPLLPQHWAICGWCPLAPAKSMAPSSTRFSTWPSRREAADQDTCVSCKKVKKNCAPSILGGTSNSNIIDVLWDQNKHRFGSGASVSFKSIVSRLYFCCGKVTPTTFVGADVRFHRYITRVVSCFGLWTSIAVLGLCCSPYIYIYTPGRRRFNLSLDSQVWAS